MTPNPTLPVLPAQWVTFRGQGAAAHLAPANGFPPQVYAPLLEPLRAMLAPFALLPYAMRATTPPPRRLEWVALADEMAAHLRDRGAQGLIGLGHSLGSVLTLMAAVRWPGLFRALVLLDPVFLPPWALAGMRLLRLVGQETRFPLARKALRRRRTFATRDQAAARYRSRSLFRAWHPQAFEAYLQHGLRMQPHRGLTLAYDPRWEAAIFARVPVDVWRWVRRGAQSGLPTLIVYGARSEIYPPANVRRLRRTWPEATLVAMEGYGHMFPMEAPEATAQVLRQWLARL